VHTPDLYEGPTVDDLFTDDSLAAFDAQAAELVRRRVLGFLERVR
jgi:hypothetical protein